MYENDPNRFDRPTVDPTVAPVVSPRLALGGLLAFAILLLAVAFWPPGNDSRTNVTDNTPTYRAPAAPSTTPPGPQ
jgi:hypothetical protein